MTWCSAMVCISNCTARASNPDMSAPIACHLHDYIEIACLYRLEVELTLSDGQRLQGRALTTRTQNREEFLLLQTTEGESSVALGRLKRMTALQPNTHFSAIDF